jgi:hypothetical protein
MSKRISNFYENLRLSHYNFLQNPLIVLVLLKLLPNMMARTQVRILNTILLLTGLRPSLCGGAATLPAVRHNVEALSRINVVCTLSAWLQNQVENIAKLHTGIIADSSSPCRLDFSYPSNSDTWIGRTLGPKSEVEMDMWSVSFLLLEGLTSHRTTPAGLLSLMELYCILDQTYCGKSEELRVYDSSVLPPTLIELLLRLLRTGRQRARVDERDEDTFSAAELEYSYVQSRRTAWISSKRIDASSFSSHKFRNGSVVIAHVTGNKWPSKTVGFSLSFWFQLRAVFTRHEVCKGGLKDVQEDCECTPNPVEMFSFSFCRYIHTLDTLNRVRRLVMESVIFIQQAAA